MDALFSIIVDAPRNVVRITLSGFFTEDDIRRFVAARDAAHGAFARDPGKHATLVDIRGMNIQSQSAVAAFTKVLADPAVRSRRIAFVVDKSLARLQLIRAAKGRGQQFHTIAEAEEWLLAGGTASASRAA